MEHFAKKWSCIFRTLLFIGLTCFNVSVQSMHTASEWPLDFPENYTTAYLNITYNTTNGSVVNEISETGRYVMGANITSVSGVLLHVNSVKNGTINHYGCDPIFDEPKEEWIALVKRGMCDFQLKLENAFAKKAIGIVVYDGGRNESLDDMKFSANAIPVIFTYKSEVRLFFLVRPGPTDPTRTPVVTALDEGLKSTETPAAPTYDNNHYGHLNQILHTAATNNSASGIFVGIDTTRWKRVVRFSYLIFQPDLRPFLHLF
ncbi:unnamed protein product [Orchesella dallaii]|uniref:PA domain-containing protein n=1 Tax=Orchesella dallaii TaxID=48710 RepID=A0ABP1RNW9_9HEXA